MNRRANRGRMGKSQKSAKPYGRATPNWIPQSGIHFSPSLSQAKDHPSINVRKILDTTYIKEWIDENKEPERSPRKLGKVETSRGPHSARSIFDDIDAEVGIINK